MRSLLLTLSVFSVLASGALVPLYAYCCVKRQPVSPLGPLAAWSALLIINTVILVRIIA